MSALIKRQLHFKHAITLIAIDKAVATLLWLSIGCLILLLLPLPLFDIIRRFSNTDSNADFLSLFSLYFTHGRMSQATLSPHSRFHLLLALIEPIIGEL